MRISDWSSDVCSSDLRLAARLGRAERGMGEITERAQPIVDRHQNHTLPREGGAVENREGARTDHMGAAMDPDHHWPLSRPRRTPDVQPEAILNLIYRKSVLEGKSVSVRRDSRGRRISH